MKCKIKRLQYFCNDLKSKPTFWIFKVYVFQRKISKTDIIKLHTKKEKCWRGFTLLLETFLTLPQQKLVIRLCPVFCCVDCSPKLNDDLMKVFKLKIIFLPVSVSCHETTKALQNLDSFLFMFKSLNQEVRIKEDLWKFINKNKLRKIK